MRISDWSSDVCSSDLPVHGPVHGCGARLRDDPGAAGRGGRLPRARPGNVAAVPGAQPVPFNGEGAAAAGSVDGTGEAVPGVPDVRHGRVARLRSEEHTSELQSLMRISYAVFCLNKKT